MKSICFASNNAHKLAEIRSAMASFDLEIKSLNECAIFDELPETGNTLQANALQKAMYVFDKYQIPCFSDDTGLMVEALNGEPGVYAARYAGEPVDVEKNIQKLLENMKAMTNRNAKFVTVIAFVVAKDEFYFFEGGVKGVIALDKSGNTGFGYDPIFIPDGYKETFAELGAEIKNQISHRTNAVKEFVNFFNNLKQPNAI